MKKYTKILAGIMAAGICIATGNLQYTVVPLDISAVSANENEVLAGYAEEILELVNEARTKAGLEPLVFNPELNAIADIRANEIIDVYSHTRPNGTIFDTLYDENNLSAYLVGENILMAYVSDDIPQYAVDSWLRSEGHRENILHDEFRNIGIGVAYNNGCYYFVQNFASDIVKWDLLGNTLKISCSGSIPDYSVNNRPWSLEREKIKEISFGDDVTGIGQWVFAFMPDVGSVVLPENIKQVGLYAFYGCTSLEKITFMNPDCEIADDFLTISQNTVIYGYVNSTAQEYAEKYNYEFESLGEAPVTSGTVPSESDLLGDANKDGTVSIADAVLIMQSLSNADKYKISEECRNAADIVDRGDGITSKDALAIQFIEAKVIEISDLPLTSEQIAKLIE